MYYSSSASCGGLALFRDFCVLFVCERTPSVRTELVWRQTVPTSEGRGERGVVVVRSSALSLSLRLSLCSVKPFTWPLMWAAGTSHRARQRGVRFPTDCAVGDERAPHKGVLTSPGQRQKVKMAKERLASTSFEGSPPSSAAARTTLDWVVALPSEGGHGSHFPSSPPAPSTGDSRDHPPRARLNNRPEHRSPYRQCRNVVPHVRHRACRRRRRLGALHAWSAAPASWPWSAAGESALAWPRPFPRRGPPTGGAPRGAGRRQRVPCPDRRAARRGSFSLPPGGRGTPGGSPCPRREDAGAAPRRGRPHLATSIPGAHKPKQEVPVVKFRHGSRFRALDLSDYSC